MADRSKIEWTDSTWNPVRARRLSSIIDGKGIGWHCEHVSEGCRNCYAETFNRRLGTGLDYKPGNRAGLDILLDEKMLLAPLRWRWPRKIFVGSMTDLFADFVSDAMLDQLFAVMALAPQHVFQLLTKRPERMRAWLIRLEAAVRDWFERADPDALNEYFPHFGTSLAHPAGPRVWPLPNVWCGTSVEDQAAADARVPLLLATPAAKRFLSCEPLLGPVDLINIDARVSETGMAEPSGLRWIDVLTGEWQDCEGGVPGILAYPDPKIDWVIAGGESGREARPANPQWFRDLRDQCAEAGVPFFHKQNGEFAPGEIAGDYLDPDKPAKGMSWFDGAWSEEWSEVDGHCDDEPDVYRIGKARAGRLLDGVTHDGMPS